jgi:hypothetical protein
VILLPISPATLPASAGFLAGRADIRCHSRRYRHRVTAALYAPRGIDLAFVRTLEEDIAAEYRYRGFLNPPTLRTFLPEGLS